MMRRILIAGTLVAALAPFAAPRFARAQAVPNTVEPNARWQVACLPDGTYTCGDRTCDQPYYCCGS
jgi:hypothetical protein